MFFCHLFQTGYFSGKGSSDAQIMKTFYVSTVSCSRTVIHLLIHLAITQVIDGTSDERFLTLIQDYMYCTCTHVSCIYSVYGMPLKKFTFS